ncbi:MAG: YsnF/AvaK domain-containing protein [Armatimonadota bacterium]
MKVVTGVFDTVGRAEDTIKALLDAGISDDDIGVVVRDSGKGATIADDLGREYASGATPPREVVTSRSTVWDRFPEMYTDVVHRGGLPADAMDWYGNHLNQGHILVIVNAGDRLDRVTQIMRDRGGYLYGAARGTTERMAETTTRTAQEGEVRLPIVEEEATVEKVRHQVGEVTVSSETTSRSVEIPAVVMHEELRVERRKLDHPVHPDEYKGMQDEKGVLRMPIVEEEVRVTKYPVVREELIVTRVPVEEQQTLRETISRTEPHIETTGDVEIERKEEGKQRPAA